MIAVSSDYDCGSLQLAGAIAVGGGMIVIQAFTQTATKVVDLGVKATTGL